MPKQPRLRGESFKGKWSLGAWAEKLIVEAINHSHKFVAVPYGKSEVGPTSYEEIQTYWSDYLARGVHGKRPDILVFNREQFIALKKDNDLRNLPDNLANYQENEIEYIVNQALLGIEAEASIWQGEKMKDYGRSWSERIGRRKAARDIKEWTAPTVIVKHQDIQSLLDWQKAYKKPIYIVHLFYDLAFMLDFAKLLEYIKQGVVSIEKYDYDGVPKDIYKTFYGLASVFGEFKELAEVVSYPYQTKGGKFKSDLYFSGGKLSLSETTIEEWLNLAKR